MWSPHCVILFSEFEVKGQGLCLHCSWISRWPAGRASLVGVPFFYFFYLLFFILFASRGDFIVGLLY